MTSVSNVATQPAVPSPAPTGSSKLGKDEFLKLLMAQLGNQDPTSPTDNQAFVAQLAQFATVEQLNTANARLDALLVASAAANQVAATNLVGRDVSLRTNGLEHKVGQTESIRLGVPAGANSATLVIKDAQGKTVRTLTAGALKAGETALTWDGLDEKGNPVPNGTLTLVATASDASGAAIPVEVHQRLHVDGISYANGFPELMVGSQRFKMSDILEIQEAA